MDENTLQSLLSLTDAAKHVGLPKHALVRMNGAGFGPPVAFTVGKSYLYRTADLDAWNADRLARKAA